MFVKVLHDKGSSVDMWECDRAHYRPCSVEEDPTLTHIELVMFKYEGDGKELWCKTLEFLCEDLEFIYMNSLGQTVDRKIW